MIRFCYDSYDFLSAAVSPGKIWVLMEPFTLRCAEPLRDLYLGLAVGKARVQALVFASDQATAAAGTRLIWVDGGTIEGASGCPDDLVRAIRADFEHGREGVGHWPSPGACPGPSISYVTEKLKKPPHLHLFGAGPDADAVYELTTALGWGISIYDHRQTLLNPTRFPAAIGLIQTHYEDPWAPPSLDAESPCLVMTHHLPRDLVLIPKLLKTESPYIGVLGARKRAALIRDALRQEGFTDAALMRLFSPVGFDIGARDPWTIALSILGQTQSVLHHGSISGFSGGVA